MRKNRLLYVQVTFEISILTIARFLYFATFAIAGGVPRFSIPSVAEPSGKANRLVPTSSTD